MTTTFGLKSRRAISTCALVLLGISASSAVLAQGAQEQAPEGPRIGEKIADFLVDAHPDLDAWTQKRWEYTNGILLTGMIKVHDRLAATPVESAEKSARLARYRTYVQRFADRFVTAEGTIGYGSKGDARYADVPFNQDLIQPSNILYFLAAQTGEEKYRKALAETRALFARFPRTTSGTFWHKQNYAYQTWLDGLYMSEPFLAHYGATVAGDPEDRAACFDTATQQLALTAEKTRRESSKSLLVHAWLDRPGLDAALARGDANVTQPPWRWDAPQTGQSPEIWGRALGWYIMALVDVLADLPPDHPQKSALAAILTTLAAGLEAYQDPATGLWYEVVDKAPRPDGTYADNFLETSGSAMFVYALRRGADLGLLDAHFREVAARGFEGVRSKVTVDATTVTVRDAMAGMGVQDSYAHYIQPLVPGTPPTLAPGRVDNAPQGLAAVMFAASVMEY